jgi:AmmeMemoRadiSam system protein A
MSAAETDLRGARLVAIAREAIADPEAFANARWAESWLLAPGATFVTLKLERALRGCIGSLEARRALGDDVAHNARAAAYADPRFPPVDAAERDRLEVEVSLLSRPEPLVGVASEQEALARLRPGIDGVVLEMGPYRSTFLPQVWEGIPDPAEFLGELKRKAGLPRHFWDPGVKLSRYTVEKFR